MSFFVFKNYQNQELGFRSLKTTPTILLLMLAFTLIKAEDAPICYKYQNTKISLLVRGIISNRDGKDDEIKTVVKIERDDSLFYQADSKIFVRLGTAKMCQFRNFITNEVGYFKITSFLDSPYDVDRSNDTLVGYFWIKDTIGLPEPYLLNEGFDEWLAQNSLNQHWLRPKSNLYLRRGSEWPWNSNLTNYMCLRGDTRGYCCETLYSTNIIYPEDNETLRLKFRVLFWPNKPAQYKARVVYSTDEGKTWSNVLTSYKTYKNGYDSVNVIVNSATRNSKVKIAWIYSGDLTDIVAWCIDDVTIIPTITPGVDVAPTDICSPSEIITPNDSQSVCFIIRNFGGYKAKNIKAEAWIGKNHSDTIIPCLPPFAETLVRLTVSAPNEGKYLLKVITSIANDEDQCVMNDTLSDIILVTALPFKVTGINEEETFEVKPSLFMLYQNYPNPFKKKTKIKYGLPVPSKVKLSIHDITGQKVRKLFDGEQEEGYYQIIWDGTDSKQRKLPSGIYFYILETEKVSFTKEIIISK